MRCAGVRPVDFGPVRGGEASERRPAVVVGSDRAEAAAERLGRGVVAVVAVSGDTAGVFPFQVLLGARVTGLHVDRGARAEQVRAVSVDRAGPVLGRLPSKALDALDGASRLHLAL
ncbi:type II toxin-antitoxin system PemK/MazF family toxin [Kineococcus sp. SYSU DK018]|uniref:type II toxin-antitoxin system PemK/MazF family toxin n=1 Tax=Kineococcus sp. SYSU DK018 TaxID=3383139 RepID=UPI003D7CD77C